MSGRQIRGRVTTCFEVPEVDVVSCHAFSRDGKLLALCPGSEEILLFRRRGGDFERAHVLAKHAQLVTGVDWSVSGRLVSVSEDRTAYVWEATGPGGGWAAVTAVLRAPLAGLCVAWAPNGLRFAIGLSSNDTAVCHYQQDVECWVAKKVGASKAAVTAVAWHPTSSFLATGSTDRKVMVYDVNEAGEPPFGDAQLADDMGAWVNAVAFSPPKGRILAAVAQDSTVRFKALAGGPESPVEVVRWKRLPFLQATFVSEQLLVACGFDCMPVLFSQAGGKWHLHGILDVGPKVSSVMRSRESYEDARNLFTRSGAKEGAEDTKSVTWHTNTITTCTAQADMRFSTSALDGQVIEWEVLA
mmetsp:Transcript_25279/g.71288  ORF Transcript_25279/g.71288 Transcript_25279/m.71288 type:complete len:357 (+) Transcript_25279:70-1140(+)